MMAPPANAVRRIDAWNAVGVRNLYSASAKQNAANPASAPLLAGCIGAPRRTAQSIAIQGTAAKAQIDAKYASSAGGDVATTGPIPTVHAVPRIAVASRRYNGAASRPGIELRNAAGLLFL